MAGWEDLRDPIRRAILRVRNRENLTNPLRTNYYQRYWEANPEIPWALLANLVSRNAGYQMSDLARFVTKIEYGRLLVPREGQGTITFATWQCVFLWCFLEVGNFLIFRDVSPALEGWVHAKRHPDYAEEIFDMLSEPEFDVDPFAIEQWKDFFALGDARTEADVQRHTFALVTNEQNQIEDRLVKDPTPYLGGFATSASLVLSIAGALGQTLLGFPLATSVDDPTANRLLIYKVSDFRSLDARIGTGRNLYVGLFDTPSVRARVQAWTKARREHRGTRVDYNDPYYSVDVLSLAPGVPLPGVIDETYSPPLVRWNSFVDAAWYSNLPMRTRLWGHLYRRPVPLPVPVAQRGDMQIQKWLSPLSTPEQPLVEHQLSDLAEIVDGDLQWL